MAFATNSHVKPYALKEIEKAIKREMNYPEDMKMQHDLMHLQKQGVILLNTALTVEKGKIGGHFKYYQDLINLTISEIDKKPEEEKVVFVFMGQQAQSFMHLVNPLIHEVIKVEHPTASYYNNREWKSNDLFKQISKHHAIKWI